MARLKCPRCATIFETTPGAPKVCPSCGFTKAPARPEAPPPYQAPTPAYGAPPPAAYAPSPVQPPAPNWAPAAAGPPAAPPGQVAGRPRKFIVGLLLVIVTLGVYAWVWNYKVYAEVDREFGRPHEQLWFWLALVPYVGLIFFVIYWVKEITKLNESRMVAQLAPAMSPLGFILWASVGALILVGPFIAYYKAQKALNQLWYNVYQAKGAPWSFPVPTV